MRRPRSSEQNRGLAKGSSGSWVAKLKGDEKTECKLPNGRSRSCREMNLLLSARKLATAKRQKDKSATLVSTQLCDPSICILVHSLKNSQTLPYVSFVSWAERNKIAIAVSSCCKHSCCRPNRSGDFVFLERYHTQTLNRLCFQRKQQIELQGFSLGLR